MTENITIQMKSKLSTGWRMKQAAFREAVAAAKKGEVMGDGTIDDRVLCQFCGRKFRAVAAVRHIPLCKKKFEDNKHKKMATMRKK